METLRSPDGTWRTPPADYDPVADSRQLLVSLHELLETAESFVGLEDEPPGLHFQYLQEAADQAKAVWMAVQTAAGMAQRRCEGSARERGMELCNRCKNWLPQAQVKLVPIGYRASDERRVNHEWLCDFCRTAEEKEQRC